MAVMRVFTSTLAGYREKGEILSVRGGTKVQIGKQLLVRSASAINQRAAPQASESNRQTSSGEISEGAFLYTRRTTQVGSTCQK